MSAPYPPLPLVILAGSNREAAVLPPSGAGKHPLVGSKGLDIRIGGRPVIDHLLDRVAASGGFDPVFIAGPRRIYGERRGEAEVLDTHASFGGNIEHATVEVSRRRPGQPIFFTTCDIVPEVADLRRCLDDYHGHGPRDFWFPLILAPDDPAALGASGWKPRYRVAPRPGEPGRSVLPGHLMGAFTPAFDLDLVFRSFETAYRSRNRHILYRWLVMSGGTLFHLLKADLRRILRLRPPVRTVGSIWQGFMIGRHASLGVISRQELEDRLWRIFCRPRHRRLHPQRRGRMPFIEGLSLAKDIDTVEEAEERARDMGET